VTADCTWHANDRRRESVPGDHVALFACAREHMWARPLCGECADKARESSGFLCRECAVADGTEDPVCFITLVCSRVEWMALIDSGRVRFARPAVSSGAAVTITQGEATR
jgi:hypothetical protein